MKRKIALLLAVLMVAALVPAQTAQAAVFWNLRTTNNPSTARGSVAFIERGNAVGPANAQYSATYDDDAKYVRMAPELGLEILNGVETGDRFKITLSNATFFTDAGSSYTGRATAAAATSGLAGAGITAVAEPGADANRLFPIDVIQFTELAPESFLQNGTIVISPPDNCKFILSGAGSASLQFGGGLFPNQSAKVSGPRLTNGEVCLDFSGIRPSESSLGVMRIDGLGLTLEAEGVVDEGPVYAKINVETNDGETEYKYYTSVSIGVKTSFINIGPEIPGGAQNYRTVTFDGAVGDNFWAAVQVFSSQAYAAPDNRSNIFMVDLPKGAQSITVSYNTKNASRIYVTLYRGKEGTVPDITDPRTYEECWEATR